MMRRMVKKGDRVKDFYGKIHTVAIQIYSTVYTNDGEWIHREKCTLLDANGVAVDKFIWEAGDVKIKNNEA